MIEVCARHGQPLGMPPARFLRDYWQKRPLLIRGAFTSFEETITPEDLAGLACEEAALARIVVRDRKRDRWAVRTGPFTESDFAGLPATDWTLLVQDVDKWDADVARLLEAFSFVPAWRIDDVMVSYAVSGGGVGAHVDQYDVFLIQGRGRRRWRITTDANASKEFRTDTELKLLRQFSPSHDWVLEPGDALYLPPGVPHEGTALDACMTFSVGMRAPSRAELLLDLAESLAEPLGEELRYSDPDLQPARDPHEIDAAALRRAAHELEFLRATDSEAFADWFGAFITRYRSANTAAPRARALSAAQVAKRLCNTTLLRHPWSRFAWRRAGKKGAALYVAGQRYSCPLALAQVLCAQREIDPSVRPALFAKQQALSAITCLINDGHLHLATRR